MKHTLPEVDAYIGRSAQFAQPILKKVRRLYHQACPEVREEMKWGTPFFVHQGILGGVMAFKAHVNVLFWKMALINDPTGWLRPEADSKMPARRVTSLKDLPTDKVLLDYILQAVALNEAGESPPRKKPQKAKDLAIPDDLAAALKKNKAARTTFENFSPSGRNEYIQWITEAKQPATRERRLATTLEWLAEGKTRNWKYEWKPKKT